MMTHQWDIDGGRWNRAYRGTMQIDWGAEVEGCKGKELSFLGNNRSWSPWNNHQEGHNKKYMGFNEAKISRFNQGQKGSTKDFEILQMKEGETMNAYFSLISVCIINPFSKWYTLHFPCWIKIVKPFSWSCPMLNRLFLSSGT